MQTSCTSLSQFSNGGVISSESTSAGIPCVDISILSHPCFLSQIQCLHGHVNANKAGRHMRSLLLCRTKSLHERDPVNTLKLGDMVKATLPQASAAHGGNVFNDALNALDPTLAGQLQAILRC